MMKIGPRVTEQLAQNVWLPLGHISVPAEVALKAAVLVGVSAAVAQLLRSRSAALRHDVWLVAMSLLLVVVALPGVAIALRSSSGERTTAPSLGGQREPNGPATAVAADNASSASGPGRSADRGMEREAEATPDARKKSLESVLHALWFLGVIVCIARFTVGLLLLRTWSRGARPVEDPAWIRDAERTCADAGLRVPLRLLWSAHVAVPMVWGRRRPMLFLPDAATDWSPECRRAVLRHEVAHVTRNDLLVEIVVQLVSALLWFHPCVWFAGRQIRLERERACDDVTLALVHRPLDYAHHLFAIADAARARATIPSLAQHAVSRGALESRIASLLDPTVQHTLPTGRLRGAAMALSALVSTPILVLSPVAYAAAHGCAASAAFLSAPTRLFF